MSLEMIIGSIAAIASILGYVPQVLKSWRTRRVGDISTSMVLLLLFSLSSWLVYGFLVGDLPLIATNTVSLSLPVSPPRGQAKIREEKDRENEDCWRMKKRKMTSKDRFNYGGYSYERKGLLEEIPHRKFAKNVLLLKEEDHEQLIQILEKYEAEYYAGFIEKTSEAGEILSR